MKIFRYPLFSRIFFVLVAILAPLFVKLEEGYIGRQIDASSPFLVWIWANFDGRHYIEIASQGYQNFDFAYFPLYPLLIRFVHGATTLPYLYSGIMVSVAFFLGALYMVYKIIILDHPRRLTTLAIILLCFFPLSFFYHSVYSDSLFLFLTTTSFYFARKGRWGLSGTFGAVSILTRISGVALIPALAAEWHLQQSKKQNTSSSSPVKIKYTNQIFKIRDLVYTFFRKGVFKEVLLAIGITFFGLVIYMTYLQIFHGDAFLFQRSLSAWNQQNWIFPPQVIWRYLKIFWFVAKDTLVYWVAVLEFVSFFAYMGLSVYVAKHIRLSYGIFMAALLLLVTFTGTFAGTPRFILHLFPAFLGMAVIFQKRIWGKVFVFALFLVLGLILTGLFTRGYFVA